MIELNHASTLPDFITMLRMGGQVRRFHIAPIIGEQTLAEHQYHVAMLCYWLWREAYQEEPSMHLMMVALTHDLPEQYTGDMPANVKRDSILKERMDALEEEFVEQYALGWPLTDEEKLVLKWADTLEGLLFCLEQKRLGNTNLGLIVSRWLSWARKLPHCAPAEELMKNIVMEYSK